MLLLVTIQAMTYLRELRVERLQSLEPAPVPIQSRLDRVPTARHLEAPGDLLVFILSGLKQHSAGEHRAYQTY